MSSLRAAVLAVVLLVAGGACGDGGGPVSGEGSASGTGTGSATGTGSVSGTGTGSASGTGTGGAGECVTEGAVLQSADSELAVALDEWEVRPASASVEAGVIEIVATNEGEDAHEIVIVRAAEDDLTVEDGAVQEDALPAAAFIGEIEAFASGETCEAHFELDAGSYTFFCNIVEEEPDGTIESHFEEGMVTSVEVR